MTCNKERRGSTTTILKYLGRAEWKRPKSEEQEVAQYLYNLEKVIHLSSLDCKIGTIITLMDCIRR